MATDARISTALPSHHKTKKLARRLGAAGPLGCIYLFLWVASHRSDGDLAGMTDEDIELAVDWEGEEGAFVRAMVDVGFLEGDEGARHVHDWAEHNPWAAGSEARSEKSRWAALCKQHGRAEAARQMPEYALRIGAATPPQQGGAPESAAGKPGAVPESASGTQVAEVGSAPSPSRLLSDSSPSPSPSPTPSPRKASAKAGAEEDPAFMAAWEEYPRRPGNSRAEAFRAWSARLRDGVSPEVMAAGVARYAAHVKAMKTEPRFIKQAATFFGPDRHFDDAWELPRSAQQDFAAKNAESKRLLGIKIQPPTQETFDA